MAELTDNKLIRLIKYAPASIVALFTLIWVVFSIQTALDNSQQELESLREQNQQRQEDLIKNQVNYITQQVTFAKNRTEHQLESTIKSRIYEAHKIATRLYEANKDKPEEQVTKLITDALRDIRFNDGRGYFFIYKTNGINIMHPLLPQVEGKSLWDFKDVRGSYIVREMGEQVKEYGEAFYRWWFVKPQNKNQEFEKVGFGKYFEPYDWFIGTGDYVVDVEADIQREVLGWVKQLRFGEYGYAFIFDLQGNVLAHIDRSLVGANVLDITENPDRIEEMTQLLAADKQFITYQSPYIPNNVSDPTKNSYVVQLKDWNWVIGSGSYAQVTDRYLNEREQQVRELNERALTQMATIGTITTIVVAFFSLALSRMIGRRFERFQSKISSDFNSLEDTKNQLEHMALHDSLTGLPNRTLLHEHINKGIERSQQEYKQLAVMFVDLDDFKKVNDLYGHSAGDLLLGKIGEHFNALLGDDEVVARFGGDEFVFCFPCLSSLSEAEKKVEMIQNVFKQQFVIEGKVLHTSCTIGVSMYPSDGDQPEELISKADIVLYKSKAKQKGDVLFFDQTINRQVQYDFLLERELRDALDRGEISIHYQPQIEAATGELYGVEALLRWHNQQLGHVSPAEFISVAEEIGLIDDLGMFVMSRACQEIGELFGNDEMPICLSINLSPLQLMAPDFLPRLQELMETTKLDSQHLTLEITENVLINDLVKVTPVIESLRSLGFSISLDDFGTGYSSLSYLSHLPINEIKIDRSFVDKMMSSKQSDSLVKAIIAIGHSSSMKIVAEGVETETQKDVLNAYGCDILQGYYIDKPLTIEQLKANYVDKSA
ncbi:cache domain-containing protein [Vibrio sp. SCSIO 43136]|uniref:bifunctional diguanylate cyclase/phosphodiesterase n=1 Tax=Vibrio sp. SCSIO 43136 TaxID=2819101 RepID=UPI002075AE06|nr:cache domain-containing protein [Vibrio sp. SCSIO 43136]USD64258.1 cache domain-containing protein [Vibrio sp. SCSIO 43136]